MTHAPNPGPHGLPGTLIVLEGIDRSGRSTHARRLEDHLRSAGHGVVRTSLTTSLVASEAIRRAKAAGRIDPPAMALLAAADLAERLEQAILPGLRAGIVVIADRYRWTPMARAESRGAPRDWLERVFAFVPRPDAVLLLEVDPVTSLTRRDRDPDPYEAGLDLGLAPGIAESYRLFQGRLSACLDRDARAQGFIRIPAAADADRVWPAVRMAADAVLAGRSADHPGSVVGVAS